MSFLNFIFKCYPSNSKLTLLRDGIQDSQDNCPKLANSDQLDTDGDGRGDFCDPDADNDGILNVDDNCPIAYNPDQLDANSEFRSIFFISSSDS